MGALRAFDLLAVNRTVNDFDIYVGTSAGAFVGSMVANGITPEEMFRVLDKALPSPIENASLRTLLRPNYKGFATRLAVLPLRVAAMARRLAGNIGEISMVDVVMGLAEGLPTGVYHNRGIEQYVRNVLSDPDRTNDFRELEQRSADRGDRSGHLRADRLRRGRVGQRPDLARRRRLGRAADRLRALRAPGQAVDRRRDHLHDQRRRRR